MDAFGKNADCVVRVKALMVLNAHPKVFDSTVAPETGFKLTSSVFTKHKVLAVESSKLSLIFALHRCLDWSFKNVLYPINQISNRERFY